MPSAAKAKKAAAKKFPTSKASASKAAATTAPAPAAAQPVQADVQVWQRLCGWVCLCLPPQWNVLGCNFIKK